jgi:hypothetical protein
MDKKIINEEQFKKLVIKEAKKIFSEDEKLISAAEEIKTESKRLSIDEVDKLIKEMEEMNTSITSLSLSILDESEKVSKETIEESTGPNRELDVNEHNRKKNVKHVNENEKDRIKRMLNYNVPKDEDR